MHLIIEAFLIARHACRDTVREVFGDCADIRANTDGGETLLAHVRGNPRHRHVDTRLLAHPNVTLPTPCNGQLLPRLGVMRRDDIAQFAAQARAPGDRLQLHSLASHFQAHCARFTCRETLAVSAWNIRVSLCYWVLLSASKTPDLVTNLVISNFLFRAAKYAKAAKWSLAGRRGSNPRPPA